VLGVLILLAGAGEPMPLLDAKSSKSLHAYGSCFSREADRAQRAWGFLPTEVGGTFTDSGAHGAPASYWLQLRDAGGETRVRLFTSGSVASDIVEAAGKCR